MVKTILYITRDYRPYIGQQAVELYYQHNVDRLRHFVPKWAGEIDYRGADMHYVRDIFVMVDELKPGRLLQYLKTALRKVGGPGGYTGTHIFERYYTTADLVSTYLRQLKQRAEAHLGEPVQRRHPGPPGGILARARARPPGRRHPAPGSRNGWLSSRSILSWNRSPRPCTTNRRSPTPRMCSSSTSAAARWISPSCAWATSAARCTPTAASASPAATSTAPSSKPACCPTSAHGQVHYPSEIVELIEAVPDWMALPELSTPQVKHSLEQAILSGTAPARLNTLKALIFNDLAFNFYNQVEAAKIALSAQGATVIRLAEHGLDLWELYTRLQFEQDIRTHAQQIEQVVLETVAASGLEPAQIDAVVKTGGSSGIPAFSEMLGQPLRPATR